MREGVTSIAGTSFVAAIATQRSMECGIVGSAPAKHFPKHPPTLNILIQRRAGLRAQR